MKKTAIITFHNSDNCGSMLQALALQEIIKKEIETDVQIIDFSSEGQKELYSIFAKPTSIRKIVKNILCVPVYKKLKKQKEDYKKFMQHFQLTDKHYSYNAELAELDGKYDYYVCGSDQVWNIRCPDADDAYFLNFVHNGRKIAYAPSLGGANLADVAKDPSKYERLMNDIEYISIREANGKRWLEEMLHREVPIILDPTFLLSKDEWNDYALKQRVIEGNYIFYYAFHYSKEQNEIVRNISKKMNMPVVSMDVKTWMIRGVFAYGVKLSPEYGPAAFLNLISNANMILTRSFHGVAFSTIFEKNFWMLGKITNPNGDDRAVSILNQLGLRHRMISLDEIKDGVDLNEAIDYAPVKSKLSTLQDKSIQFLKDAFAYR